LVAGRVDFGQVVAHLRRRRTSHTWRRGTAEKEKAGRGGVGSESSTRGRRCRRVFTLNSYRQREREREREGGRVGGHLVVDSFFQPTQEQDARRARGKRKTAGARQTTSERILSLFTLSLSRARVSHTPFDDVLCKPLSRSQILYIYTNNSMPVCPPPLYLSIYLSIYLQITHTPAHTRTHTHTHAPARQALALREVLQVAAALRHSGLRIVLHTRACICTRVDLPAHLNFT
jgi:hypothetical protein